MKNCKIAISKRKPLRRNTLKLVLASVTVAGVLSACSSAPVPALNLNVSATEQNALNALMLQNTTEAHRSLDLALREYEQYDDLYGRWRIASLKTKLALGSSKLDEAKKIAPSLKTIAEQLNDNLVTYQTSILLGRVYLDDSYFHQALGYAATRLEQGTVYAYLGEPHRAVELIDPDDKDHPAERAFIYYQAGIASGNSDHFGKALGYYRAAQDARGVADSLFRMARIAAGRSDTESAVRYADRAIKSLESANHPANARIIRNWVKKL